MTGEPSSSSLSSEVEDVKDGHRVGEGGIGKESIRCHSSVCKSAGGDSSANDTRFCNLNGAGRMGDEVIDSFRSWLHDRILGFRACL